MIKTYQDEIIGQLGPNNPIVTPSMAVKTRQMIAQAGGIAYPENVFRDPGENFQVPPPAPPQPTPDAMVYAEVEKYKADKKVETDTIKIVSDERVTLAKMQNDKEIAIAKAQIEAALEAEKLGIDRAKVLVDAAKVDSDRQANEDKKEIETTKADAALAKAAAAKVKRRNAA
jgi:hypothetical protein